MSREHTKTTALLMRTGPLSLANSCLNSRLLSVSSSCQQAVGVGKSVGDGSDFRTSPVCWRSMPERKPAAPPQPPFPPSPIPPANSRRGRKAGGHDQPWAMLRSSGPPGLRPRRGPRGPAGALLHRGFCRHPQRHPARLRRPLRLRCRNTTTTGSGSPPTTTLCEYTHTRKHLLASFIQQGQEFCDAHKHRPLCCPRLVTPGAPASRVAGAPVLFKDGDVRMAM